MIFLGIFSINARFQSELFVVCAPSEHLHGTFQATRTVSSERSRSLDQNGKFFFRARHIGRCHDGERMSPHIACQVSPLRVYDHNTRYRAFKRTQTTSWRSNEPISPDCECWIIRRTLEAPELCAFTHVCAPGERHESAVRRRCDSMSSSWIPLLCHRDVLMLFIFALQIWWNGSPGRR